MKIIITPLTSLPSFLGAKKKALDWPLEVQGYGNFDAEKNSFEIQYPSGDIFLSWAVILHELGHLRQEEFNSEIAEAKKQGRGAYMLAKEKDAYQRGWARAEKYFPEQLALLEKKFQDYKQQGKLENFSSFFDFYKFLQNSLKINKAINSVPKAANYLEQEKQEIQALKKAGVDKFFQEIKASRVGEKIDPSSAEEFIKRIVEKISQEK